MLLYHHGVLTLLLCVIQCDIASLSCAYAYSVFYRYNEYSAVANLARLSRFKFYIFKSRLANDSFNLLYTTFFLLVIITFLVSFCYLDDAKLQQKETQKGIYLTFYQQLFISDFILTSMSL